MIIKILFIIISSFAFAHSPKYSYINITQTKDKWEVLLMATYSAYISEFVATHSNKDIKNLSIKNFAKWIKTHIKDNLIIYNSKNEKINFSPMNINLAHETDATFSLLNIPKDTQTFKVVNNLFDNIEYSKHILKINNKEINE